jgi:hypothetical protein
MVHGQMALNAIRQYLKKQVEGGPAVEEKKSHLVDERKIEGN